MNITHAVRDISAISTREGRWWTIELPEIDTVTQARNVSEIEAMAREAASLHLNVAPESIHITVTIKLPDDVRIEIEEARAREAAAREAASDAAALYRHAATRLRTTYGMTLNDTGTVLGVSKARAHQLTHS
jgi:predicted RNase H-like HicB family nuclease